jgi:drug/metabolite transporter (DMT)-like permease
VRASHLIALLLMNVFWAASYAAFKVLSVRMAAGEIVTWRFTLAAAGLAAAWRWLPGRGPRGRDLLMASVMGVLVFVLGPRLQVLGVHWGQAGDASVVVALEPLVTAVGAAFFLREHVPPRRWIGFGLGMAGMIILNGGWKLELNSASMVASLVFLSSFVCEASYSVLGKPLLERASPVKLIGAALLLGTAVNLLLDGPRAFAVVERMTFVDWASLAYLSVICTLVGYTLWYVVIRDADVNLAALTILVQPVFGVAAAVILAGESIHWGQLWGSLVVVAGLWLGFGASERSLPAATSVSPTAKAEGQG